MPVVRDGGGRGVDAEDLRSAAAATAIFATTRVIIVQDSPFVTSLRANGIRLSRQLSSTCL